MRFEYLILIASHSKGWHPHVVNGKELPKWIELDLYAFLGDLGKEGWEGINSQWGGNTARFWFKRLLPKA